MPYVLFSPADGSDIETSYSTLEDLFLSRGEEFWAAGSGQAAIYCGVWRSQPELLILYDHSHGFSFEHIDKNRHRHISRMSNDSDPVFVYVGGNPIGVPSGTFVSPSKALQIAWDFVQNRGMSSAVEWVPEGELTFVYPNAE